MEYGGEGINKAIPSFGTIDIYPYCIANNVPSLLHPDFNDTAGSSSSVPVQPPESAADTPTV